MSLDYTLYFVTEESQPLQQLLSITELAIQGGVSIVQIREKNNHSKDFFQKACSLKKLTDTYQVPLIVNDRVDIALATGATGVHIGQEDLPLAEVKKIIPSSMIVGVSCSTVEEALSAEAAGANYIGVGAVFPTNSKQNAKLLPGDMLQRIIETVSIPVVAIGGINSTNISEINHLDIAGIAVVSEIMSAIDPKEMAATLRNKLSK